MISDAKTLRRLVSHQKVIENEIISTSEKLLGTMVI